MPDFPLKAAADDNRRNVREGLEIAKLILNEKRAVQVFAGRPFAFECYKTRQSLPFVDHFRTWSHPSGAPAINRPMQTLT